MLALLIVLAASLQAAGAAVFESELWPEEGRPVFAAVATKLPLYELPSSSSEVVRQLTVEPNQRLVFDQTRYRTIKPGRLTALAPASISGRMLGDITWLSTKDYYSNIFSSTVVNVSAGDTFEYLQYRAEGTCFVRVAGKTIDAELCPTERREFRLDVRPSTEWWIHLTVNGKPAGWLLVTDTTVKVVGRLG